MQFNIYENIITIVVLQFCILASLFLYNTEGDLFWMSGHN